MTLLQSAVNGIIIVLQSSKGGTTSFKKCSVKLIHIRLYHVAHVLYRNGSECFYGGIL